MKGLYNRTATDCLLEYKIIGVYQPYTE